MSVPPGADGLGPALDIPYWFRGMAGELLTSGLPLNAHSNVLESRRLVKSGPGLLFGFSATTSKATAQWIQLHDKQADNPPTAGDVPVAQFQVNGAAIATGDTVAVSYIFPGRFFLYGIWIINSTTLATCTPGAADTFYDAQYF